MPIELREVSYTYAPGTPYAAQALKKISLTVRDGEFVGVMGRTGCGKSTLIQLAAGLMAPSAGRVFLDGEDINERHFDRARLRQRVGVVFQFPEIQLFETTVEKDTAFGLKYLDWSAAKKEAAVRQALEWMGFDFEAVRNRSPFGFSGGEKRRLAIAGVLAVMPGFLLLDEPTAGLDPQGREAFLELLRKLNQDGTTVLMISHDADALAEYAGRIVILKEGTLLRDGPAAEVFSDQEGLKENGISAGQAREMAERLRRRGWDIPCGTIRYGQLLEEIAGRWPREVAGRQPHEAIGSQPEETAESQPCEVIGRWSR